MNFQNALNALKSELQDINTFLPQGLVTSVLIYEDNDLPYGGIKKDDVSHTFDYLRESWGNRTNTYPQYDEVTNEMHTQMMELIPLILQYKDNFYTQILDLIENESA